MHVMKWIKLVCLIAVFKTSISIVFIACNQYQIENKKSIIEYGHGYSIDYLKSM